MMLQIKFGYDWPTGCGDIFEFENVYGPTDGRTDGRRIDRYTISSHCEPSAQVS